MFCKLSLVASNCVRTAANGVLPCDSISEIAPTLRNVVLRDSYISVAQVATTIFDSLTPTVVALHCTQVNFTSQYYLNQ